MDKTKNCAILRQRQRATSFLLKH